MLVEADMRENIENARILVLGAAGSIGAAFVRQLSHYRPRALDLVDLSENGLVDLVREIHGTGAQFAGAFRTFAIDIRAHEFADFLAANSPYDVIVNFAAMKHVRSERDPYSLMRMIDTNALALDRMLTALSVQPRSRIFSVSSDKAVRPANMMGASKGLMERVLLRHSEKFDVSCARFANVLFSSGSLLSGFISWIDKGLPLAAPNDVRRYFISHEEAGELCLLTAFQSENRDVFFPAFNSEEESLRFDEIATSLLEHLGYEPEVCASAEEAVSKARNYRSLREKGQAERRWPCFFSPSNTAGEKDIEEFILEGEMVHEDRYTGIRVASKQSLADDETLKKTLDSLNAVRHSGQYDIENLSKILAQTVTDFQHKASSQNLDKKL